MEGSFVNQPISESAAYWWDRANFPVKAARIDESTLEVMYGYEHVERYSGIWIAGGSFVGQGSLIEDCTQIGPGSIILSAQVDSTVSIGDGCFVGEDCRLKGKLSLGTHCYVGSRCFLSGGQYGQAVFLGDSVVSGPGAQIEDFVTVGENSSLAGQIKIGKGCVIGKDVALENGELAEEVTVGAHCTGGGEFYVPALERIDAGCEIEGVPDSHNSSGRSFRLMDWEYVV